MMTWSVGQDVSAQINVGRTRPAEATLFVLMPPVNGKWQQMTNEVVEAIKENIGKINHLKCLV